MWYYFCNLDEVVSYIFPCARTLGKIGNDMVWKMRDLSGKIYTSHEFIGTLYLGLIEKNASSASQL